MNTCFTGCRDAELEKEIISQGGEVVSGVSKTTTHLITKDMEESTLSSSKAVKAKQLGVVIIDIESFKKL
jgi:NAD-dependent DNA ligase